MSESLSGLAYAGYMISLPLAAMALALCVLVGLPLALYRPTRRKAGGLFFVSSFVFGLTTWLLGATLTLGVYGVVVLIIGLLLFGVGVVPIGVFAAVVTLDSWSLGLSLIAMGALAFGARIAGAFLVAGDPAEA